MANVARARESGLQDCWYHDADLATCPNIRDLILKCTKTHESAQLRAGDPDMRHHAGDILALWRLAASRERKS